MHQYLYPHAPSLLLTLPPIPPYPQYLPRQNPQPSLPSSDLFSLFFFQYYSHSPSSIIRDLLLSDCSLGLPYRSLLGLFLDYSANYEERSLFIWGAVLYLYQIWEEGISIGDGISGCMMHAQCQWLMGWGYSFLYQITVGMDPRTQRYMQRIEQIMQMPKRGTPHRPSKSPISCKANHLDRYLKYELASKIITKILQQNNERLVQLFFSIIRMTEYRQKEKVYRFIAVEKAIPTKEVWIDAGIVCRILSNTLKGLLRRKYVEFIQALSAKPQQGGYETTPKRGKTDRRLTVQRDATQSPMSARMRTLTYVSQMENGSSRNLSEIDNGNQERSQNVLREAAAKNIARIIKAKMDRLHYLGLCRIGLQSGAVKEQGQKGSKEMVRQEKREPLRQIAQLNAFRRSGAVVMIIRIVSRIVSQDFDRLKKHKDAMQIRGSKSRLISTKIGKIFERHQYILNHHFLTRLKSITSPKKNDKQQKQPLQQSIKPKSAIKSSQKSHKSQVSQVQPFNPVAKLNFYAFIDKIVKLMMVLSKLLIPMKQAFVSIDQYASYSYRIQQSLKCVPRRVLAKAFLSIRRAKRGQGEQQDVFPKKMRSAGNIYDILHPLLKMRLIEGFTHIKVISKERDLKIKILPAKENIILLTKKFISDRDQYTAQSYQHLQELKSTLFSTSSIQVTRVRSSIR